MSKLWVIMPVYNEQSAILKVFEEWIPVLRKEVGEFEFIAINDGSTDNTLRELEKIRTHTPELTILNNRNRGHGQTCYYGYRYAYEQEAEWILQIDSDGQCDPNHFKEFWSQRSQYPAIYGYRRTREDGLKRFLISRVVSLVVFFACFVWVKDANVPYRLFSRKSLEGVLGVVPTNIDLANILVAVLHRKQIGIRWIPINFRNRVGPPQNKKVTSFAKAGAQLYRQLKSASNAPKTKPAPAELQEIYQGTSA